MANDELRKVILSDKTQRGYLISSKHRTVNPTQYKSVWTVPKDTEVHLFAECIEEGYIKQNGDGFNVDVVDRSVLETLGKSITTDRLVIGKFEIEDVRESHGYPVDHKRGESYKPDDKILEKWAEDKKLDLGTIKKIKRGKKI